MIKITCRQLAEYFEVGERTVERYAKESGGLKEVRSVIKTIINLNAKYGDRKAEE